MLWWLRRPGARVQSGSGGHGHGAGADGGERGAGAGRDPALPYGRRAPPLFAAAQVALALVAGTGPFILATVQDAVALWQAWAPLGQQRQW